MVGIVSYGAYVPRYRLGKDTVGWGGPERAVANFDEDSITMAVAAVAGCLDSQKKETIDGLLFATTTSPYAEKQASAIIATAVDLKREISTADFTNTLRGASIAMRSAIDAIKAGSSKKVLVTASDCRMAAPRSDYERTFGDGAAAFLLGDSNVVASIEASYVITDHMMDVWRASGETFVRSWEERFILDEGYQRAMRDAVVGLMKKENLTPKDFSKAVFYAPDARRHADLARRLGFDASQIQDPLFGKQGNTGAAFAPMLLVAALDEAKAGDRILYANYGDGAEAYILKVTEHIEKAPNRGNFRKLLESKKVLPNYEIYARWRDILPVETGRRPAPNPISSAALWREKDQILRLCGVKCKTCETIQYPPQRVCTKCHTKDNFEPYRFADKKGEIFTYSMDYLAATVDIPLVITVVNFQDGGRILCTMTDRELDEVKVGLPVQMSFRKLRTTGGIHNYFWKSVKIRA
ncbi:MAG: hydroxymethylglutaryl-CoA synthase family protein [Chloroflexi bacterium]|nr:hydroxymethylglutaryl-CoA synthase family protein [Chloroflexota bacterium]